MNLAMPGRASGASSHQINLLLLVANKYKK